MYGDLVMTTDYRWRIIFSRWFPSDTIIYVYRTELNDIDKTFLLLLVLQIEEIHLKRCLLTYYNTVMSLWSVISAIFDAELFIYTINAQNNMKGNYLLFSGNHGVTNRWT